METNETNNERFTVSELFGTETQPDIAGALERLSNDREQLEELLTEARYSMQRARDRIDHYDRMVTRHAQVGRAQNDLREYDRLELVKSLESLHSDSPKLSLEHGEWLIWLRLIVCAGIWAGYASDVHSLVSSLRHELGDAPNEVWHSISAELRNDEGNYPEPVSTEQAVAMAWRRYWGQLEHHPSDPRLSDGWEKIWRTAKTSGLCDVWDSMAETLGVPRAEITQSGYVTVSGTFSASVYVEGVIDGDYDIDLDEVIGNLGRYDVEIEEYDDSDLTFD